MRLGRFYSVCLVSLLIGCKPESTVTLRSNCFDVCVDASAHVDFDGQLAIATDIRDSLASARAGLVSTKNVAGAVTQFVQSIVDLKPKMPSGLEYAGSGVYRMKVDADTSVELRFTLPSNTSYGKSGDLITFNLFDVSNYFSSLGVKATTTVSLSGITTNVSFTFDKLGPGAELLGIASTASSPISIDVNAFSSQLSRVGVRATVNVNHHSNSGNVALSLVPDDVTAAAMGTTSTPLAFGVFAAENEPFEQSVTLEPSSFAFDYAHGNYAGVVRARSTSPDFSFEISIDFDASVAGDVKVGCIGSLL